MLIDNTKFVKSLHSSIKKIGAIGTKALSSDDLAILVLEHVISATEVAERGEAPCPGGKKVYCMQPKDFINLGIKGVIVNEMPTILINGFPMSAKIFKYDSIAAFKKDNLYSDLVSSSEMTVPLMIMDYSKNHGEECRIGGVYTDNLEDADQIMFRMYAPIEE